MDGDEPGRAEPDAAAKAAPEAVEPDAVEPAQAAGSDVAPAEAVAAEAVAAEPVEGPVVESAAAGESGEVPAAGVGARSRRPLVGLGVVALVLAIAVVAVSVLFVRERSAHDDARRALLAETARAAQFERDLAAVRAERAEFEKKLAATEARVLSPEAKAAIANCVNAYATVERVMVDAERGGAASGSYTFAVPVRGGVSVTPLCTTAEQYLAKVG